MTAKTLKVTASNLEAYRLWRQFDFISTEELFARIRGEKTPQTFEAQLGNAYHELVLTPSYDEFPKGVINIGGINIDTESAIDELGYILPTESTFEVWARRYFSNYWAGHTVYFLGRLDAMFGNEIIDLKVSLKGKDPVNRVDSLQWPLYCQAAHCRKFTYIDVQLRAIKASAGYPVYPAHYQTVAAKPLTLYLSDSIGRDLKVAVIDYLEFVQNAGLLDFIEDRPKRQCPFCEHEGARILSDPTKLHCPECHLTYNLKISGGNYYAKSVQKKCADR